MPWLSNLANVVRRSGLPVVEVEGWRTRGYAGRTLVSVETVVCHHTAGPKTGNMPSLNVLTNGRAGVAGPLAQLGLARDGTVYVIAAGWANHAGAVRDPSFGNAYSIGIEAEATGVDTWPEVQMDAYARLVRVLLDAEALSVSRALGHKEICAPVGRKIDPNFDMGAFRTRVSRVGTVTPTPPTPTPTPEEDVVTEQDRAAIAAETTNAVLTAIGPLLARIEDDAARARVDAGVAAAAAKAASSSSSRAHDAVLELDAVLDDRHERRDIFNTREYGNVGVQTYTELSASAPTYRVLSGAVVPLPVG